MSHYRHHVFFCVNQRDGGQPCCNALGGARVRGYAKDRLKALGLSGPGGVRVNSAGCLGRCELGPALVVYPEGVWYTYVDESDVDEIIQRHLIDGEVVERLRLPEA